MTDSTILPPPPDAPADPAADRAGEPHGASGARPVGGPGSRSDPRPIAWRLVAVFAVALVVCTVGYLAIAVPGKWFSPAEPKAWSARDLQVTRGVGRIAGDELFVTPNDPSGIVVVSIRTKFPSLDLASVAWIAIDVPDEVQASLLWRTDYKPETLNTMPLRAISGRLLPATVLDHPAWIGNVDGLALAVRGQIAEPIRIRGVTVRPHDASEVIRERMREWFAFEGWTGTSINTLTGGADLQDLPLPLLLAATVTLATLIVAGLVRWRPALFPLGVVGSLAAFTLGAWLLLDLRWTWNLGRQLEATGTQYAFRSFEEKRLVTEHGPLFAFLLKAREVLPREPARIFVVADSHYFRGRAAYDLLPHRVYFDPRANTMPRPEALRPGDWFLVYQRKGVQFDPMHGKLRWNNLPPVDVDLKLAEHGAALFQVR